MSEWNQKTSREKIEFIVRNVLKWKYFPEWSLRHTARWALDGEVKWPYAFWNGERDGICVFYKPDEYAQSFNPLESLDDAWRVARSLIPEGNMVPYPESFYAFPKHLEQICSADPFDILKVDFEPRWVYNITAERICLAVLKACGVTEHE